MAYGEDPIIKVNLKPNGKGGIDTKIEVEKAPDNSCLHATKSLQEALGKVVKTDLKPEGLKVAPVGAGTVKVGK